MIKHSFFHTLNTLTWKSHSHDSHFRTSTKLNSCERAWLRWSRQGRSLGMYPSKLPKWVNQVMVTSNTSTSLASLGKKVIPKKMKNQQIPIDFVWICLDGGFSPTPLKNDGVSSSVGMIIYSQLNGENSCSKPPSPVVEIYLSASFWDFLGPLYCFSNHGLLVKQYT